MRTGTTATETRLVVASTRSSRTSLVDSMPVSSCEPGPRYNSAGAPSVWDISGVDEHDLDVVDRSHGVGHVADRRRPLEEGLELGAGEAGTDLHPDLHEAGALVLPHGPHPEVGQLDAALPGHVVDGQGEARRDRGEIHLGGL